MFEVKVYDGSGNLKKVISEKTLNKRSEQQIHFPSLFKKGRKKEVPSSKTRKVPAKNKKH